MADWIPLEFAHEPIQPMKCLKPIILSYVSPSPSPIPPGLFENGQGARDIHLSLNSLSFDSHEALMPTIFANYPSLGLSVEQVIVCCLRNSGWFVRGVLTQAMTHIEPLSNHPLDQIHWTDIDTWTHIRSHAALYFQHRSQRFSHRSTASCFRNVRILDDLTCCMGDSHEVVSLAMRILSPGECIILAYLLNSKALQLTWMVGLLLMKGFLGVSREYSTLVPRAWNCQLQRIKNAYIHCPNTPIAVFDESSQRIPNCFAEAKASLLGILTGNGLPAPVSNLVCQFIDI